MAIPAALIPPGYSQTLADIRKAIEDRLLGLRLSTQVSFHRGTADAGAMPDIQSTTHVWLDWVDISPDADEPYEATMLVSRWSITIVGGDEGSDEFGTEAPAVERIWGDILTTFTEEIVDLGLDGTCDFVPTAHANHFRGSLSAGERRVDVVEMTLEVHHSQEIFRPNPG